MAVASVLGLVMLSVALQSCPDQLCLPEEREHLHHPQVCRSWGPPDVLFHAGFRSQFAMKFLDPSFVPITNSLTQELQEKPAKWVFNRTAFARQR
ncbi:hypothetical protein GDO86_002533 [Hymenochirus boettgeri]|uniref:Uncharacterized protein n=1 Tax=Hymenochirus boettgeri TaxID=247094 RepID=A0A8T2KL97_9PIPI|nr:hypothetical protein GDO86_002533 [Hymenochirus boettgeri]